MKFLETFGLSYSAAKPTFVGLASLVRPLKKANLRRTRKGQAASLCAEAPRAALLLLRFLACVRAYAAERFAIPGAFGTRPIQGRRRCESLVTTRTLFARNIAIRHRTLT